MTLADGASQVADGAGTLNESLVTLNNEAIKKMISAYNGDVKDSVERLQAAMEAATEYDSFGGKSDNTAGVTKFIIKTAAISAEEYTLVSTTNSSPPQNASAQAGAFSCI